MNEEDYGPAVAALNPRQLNFVLGLFKPRPNSTTRIADAYLEAGYQCADRHIAHVAGSRLMHTPALQAAIKELAGTAIIKMVPDAVEAIGEILADHGHKDRYRAAKDIAERAAPTVQKIDVEHTHKLETQEDRDRDVAAFVKKLRDMGVPREAIANEVGYSALPRYERLLAIDNSNVIDGEFVEVGSGREGLEDLLQ